MDQRANIFKTFTKDDHKNNKIFSLRYTLFGRTILKREFSEPTYKLLVHVKKTIVTKLYCIRTELVFK